MTRIFSSIKTTFSKLTGTTAIDSEVEFHKNRPIADAINGFKAALGLEANNDLYADNQRPSSKAGHTEINIYEPDREQARMVAGLLEQVTDSLEIPRIKERHFWGLQQRENFPDERFIRLTIPKDREKDLTWKLQDRTEMVHRYPGLATQMGKASMLIRKHLGNVKSIMASVRLNTDDLPSHPHVEMVLEGVPTGMGAMFQQFTGVKYEGFERPYVINMTRLKDESLGRMAEEVDRYLRMRSPRDPAGRT